MSAHSLPAVHEPNFQVATPQPDPGTKASFDARWALWIERGRRHDLAVKRKLRIALLSAAAIGILVAIFFGVAAGAR